MPTIPIVYKEAEREGACPKSHCCPGELGLNVGTEDLNLFREVTRAVGLDNSVAGVPAPNSETK